MIATIKIIFHRLVDDDVKDFTLPSIATFDINSFRTTIMKPIAAIARNSTPFGAVLACARLDVHLGQRSGLEFICAVRFADRHVQTKLRRGL